MKKEFSCPRIQFDYTDLALSDSLGCQKRGCHYFPRCLTITVRHHFIFQEISASKY